MSAFHSLHLRKVVILLFFVSVALSHWWVTPIYEMPDEGPHMGYVWYLRETHSLPTYSRHVVGDEQFPGQEASQGPLYYLLAAIVTFPIPLDDFVERWKPNPHAQAGVPLTTHNRNVFLHDWEAERFPWQETTLAVHVARLLSLALAAATLLLIHRLALLVSEGDRLMADVAVALVAFNPTFAHLAVGVNNDWLVVALGTLALLLVVRRMRESATSYRQTLFLALVTSAAILAKLGGVLLVPLFLWLVLYEWRRKRYSFGTAARHLLLFGGVVTALTGWWFARNYLLYGDPTGSIVHLWHWTIRPERSLVDILRHEVAGIWFSFWGVFGHFTLILPEWAFSFIALVGAISLLGFLRGVMQGAIVRNRLWLPVLLWALLVVLGFLRWTQFILASQGRLLYPAIAVFALLLAQGLVCWRKWLPPRAFYGVLFLSLGGLASISALSPWLIVRPGFMPPPVRDAAREQPPSAEQVAVFGDSLALERTRVDVNCGQDGGGETVLPGDTLCVTLDMVALKDLDNDYSLSLQVVPSGDNTRVAQIDTYPGSGLLPTSEWTAGMQLSDRYQLPITVVPPEFPTRLSLRLTFYDLATQERLLAVDKASGARLVEDAVTLADLRLLATGSVQVPEEARIPAVRFGDAIELVGTMVRRIEGDYRLFTYWRVLQDVPQDWTLFAHRTPSPTDVPVAAYDHILGGERFPTHLWRAGDLVVDETVLAGFPFEEGLFIGVYDPQTGARLPAMEGDVRLEADALRIMNKALSQR